jgi:hypothetical protein
MSAIDIERPGEYLAVLYKTEGFEVNKLNFQLRITDDSDSMPMVNDFSDDRFIRGRRRTPHICKVNIF